jgi:hypothetical protein
MCCLCFESKRLEELSQDADGHLTDVCLVCRQKELQAILAQVAAILAPEAVIDQSTIRPNNEITQEVVVYMRRCGHSSVRWWGDCPDCEAERG